MNYPILPTEEEISALFDDMLTRSAELDCAMQELRQKHAILMMAVSRTAASRLVSSSSPHTPSAYLHRLMKYDINAACSSFHAGYGHLADAKQSALLLVRALSE